MKAEWDKLGMTGLLFAAFFAGIWQKDVDPSTSTLFFTVALILLGVLLTQIVTDWWQRQHDGARTDASSPTGGDPGSEN